jgi:YVTN family beta-propeller protein
VANTESNTVSIIGGSSVIGGITVTDYPIGVIVNSMANRIYVANSGSDSVSVVDGASSGSVIATVALEGHPFAMAVNPNTNRIYVANSRDGTISVIEDSFTEKGGWRAAAYAALLVGLVAVVALVRAGESHAIRRLKTRRD